MSAFASVIEFLSDGGELEPDSSPVLAGLSYTGNTGNARALVAVVAVPEPPLLTKSKKMLMADGINTFQYPMHTVLVKVVRLRKLVTPPPAGKIPHSRPLFTFAPSPVLTNSHFL